MDKTLMNTLMARAMPSQPVSTGPTTRYRPAQMTAFANEAMSTLLADLEASHAHFVSHLAEGAKIPDCPHCMEIRIKELEAALKVIAAGHGCPAAVASDALGDVTA